jgi:NadR type nicotinamide-nucleotide adenylyltransferase
MQGIKKVVVIGPESTGKSTLCKTLSQHFNTTWCPEYAREYLLKNGANYTFDDLLTIAKGQLKLENDYNQLAIQKWKTDQTKSNHPLLFVDTNMYVMKVWCEYVFGKCHTFILDKIVEQETDLYLLCNIDLPWVRDELREYPDPRSREELFNIYKDILINQDAPWVLISGSNEERSEKAIQAVETLMLMA